MTAPIFFNEGPARQQLMSRGIVYTLRRERTVGLTRARQGSYYKFRDLGPVEVRLIKRRVSREALVSFVHLSGFDDVEAWVRAAAPGANRVYAVEFVDREMD